MSNPILSSIMVVATTVVAAALIGTVTLLQQISTAQTANTILLEMYTPMVTANGDAIQLISGRLLILETTSSFYKGQALQDYGETPDGR
jgi:hypothetical protein